MSAALVPVAPERSYLNAVVYDRPEALAAAYDELVAAYAEIGAKWTVWVPPADRESRALLERAGHVLDAEPALMGRELAGVERPPDSALPGWTRVGTPADVAAVNDRAYRDDTGSFAHALRRLPGGAAHLYTVLEGEEAVASAVVVDHEGNVRGYVNSMPDFTAQSQVINGASDALVQVFGDAGRHARTAIGVAVLPYDVAVEVDAVFEVR